MLHRILRAAAALAAGACCACDVATAPLVAPPDGSAPPPFEVGVHGLQLTQAVQDRAGTVPLVRGRAGLLRVFLLAARADVPAPAVRVRLVDTATGAVLRSYAPTSPLAHVPTRVVEGAPAGSWNVAVPGEDVEPGRHLVAEIDAVPGVALERLRRSLRFPAEGSLDVRPAPQLSVTLVPVVQGGLRPDVDASRTAASWLDRARALHPLGAVDVRVAAPYVTGVALGPDGAGWGALLAELDRKRAAEGTGRTYLGAVRVAYASGTAGRADVGGRAALAWDEAGSYQRVAAHELGHTFGLMHAPCGVADAGSIDPAWPEDAAHAGGRTGAFGWDPATGGLKDPATTWDHMGYCGDAATTWTSDHGFRTALELLAARSAAAVDAAGAAASPLGADLAADAPRLPCLLVSGRASAHRVELDPAYVLDTAPDVPAGGEWELELLARDGSRLASFAFAPVEPAREPGEARAGEVEAHFALALPLDERWARAAHGVAVRRGGVEVARRSLAAAPGARGGAVRVAAGPRRREVALSWDGVAHPEVMVRDPRSGEVLAFARGGAAVVQGDAPELELLFPDGAGGDVPVRARAR